MPPIIAPLLLLFAAPADTGALRAELPITMTQIGNARRYSVMITINGEPVEAALDTGSVGLRILANAFPTGGKATSRRTSIGFNLGVILEGQVVRTQVSYAGLPDADVNVQRVDAIGCRAGVAGCEASIGDPNAYRIMGEGTPDQGFSAIIGIGLRSDPLGHPLEQAGVSRWIVELPRTASETGRLILNPTDTEVADYQRIPFLAGRNEVSGCLVAAPVKACGPAMVDTGAPGITLFGFADADVPPPGTVATITLGKGADGISMPIEVGRRDQAAMVRLRPPRPDAKASLSFGIAPFLRWSILYDAKARALGVADRR